MNETDIEAAVLRMVNGAKYQPAKPRDIARKLGLDEEQTRQIRKVVKKLVRRGQLTYGPNHKVEPGKGANNEKRIVGRFHRTSGGFGFIRPEGTDKSVGRDDDIYVAARDAGDAASGDTVVARIRRKRRGVEIRTVGEIIEIVERGTSQFVGTYFEDGEYGYVQIDGTDFPLPIWVGDPGAKNAQPNDKVVIEMVRFPKAGRHGEAVITEVLGKHGKPGVDTLLVMREFDLPDEFPEDVLANAREIAEQFDENELGGRRDLTALPTITIDPKDARDFDDAISLTRLENGHWLLRVHIADVSHFVPPKSPLDAEARNRATSIYLPDRVIPMLPEIISNNLASLQPQRVRYTKTAELELTPEGTRVATEAFSAAIRSDQRFTYEEIDEFLANRESWRKKLDPHVYQLLSDMHHLAMRLRERRMTSGSIELSMREIKIDLDKKGDVTGAHQVEHTESHQIIEEFMLAANMAVAEMLRDREIKFLRRLHDSPEPRKLKSLTRFVGLLGFDVESLESRFEIKRLLELVAGRPEEYAVNYAVLRSFQKAVYGPDDAGHYALASDCYCHFTSPIRRYPDLTVHRLIDDIEAGKKNPGHSYGHLVQLGDHCSEREQRAEKAERELTKLKLLNYLKGRIGQKMEAVITGVESFGFFVLGREIPAEGLVSIQSLLDDRYDYDDALHQLIGRSRGQVFGLGDTVRVEVAHIDMDRRELDFRFVEQIKSRQVDQGGSRRRGRSTGSESDQRGTRTKGQRIRGAGKGRTKKAAKPRKKPKRRKL